ncbi:putative SERINE-TYPE PROTEASE INHIBITOR-RELATED [Vibrio nigripulchritudo SOn1]|uniref:SERINE-TYPE PROTEASE INHIBITOR-RELATED n=1 Tax=Vibrio nigripulchritudo SOn1 TaxID=1238450 RepID=A0AAV2VSF8_9VIBR|nr:leucine-rich repeat domain-containing protein [Vibrio nigripulchritudo]CCO47658.1 putative SERINE-TYPE PROTEASE INHIBITOR-RELATED [Vibrio nigripulchritudo SOn1]
MNIIKTATLIAAPLLLAACGGSSNDSSPTPEPKIAPSFALVGDGMRYGGDNVNLHANISDPDISDPNEAIEELLKYKYKWEQIDGEPVTLLNHDSYSASFVAPFSTKDQNFAFRFTATNSQGTSSTKTITVTIKGRTYVPTISLTTSQTARVGSTVNINANVKDRDGHIVKYLWEQKSGTNVVLNSNNTAQVSFTAPQVPHEESLLFQLTVVDNDGATTSKQTKVHIAPNQKPYVSFIRNVTTDINLPVSITASANDVDGTISSYRWEQTAGTSVTIANPDSPVLSFTSPTIDREDVLTFKITATDNEGAADTETVDITVQKFDNLIEKLDFKDWFNQRCMEFLATKNNWKFVDEVTDFGCDQITYQSTYESEIEKLTELTSLRIKRRGEIIIGSHPKLITLSLLSGRLTPPTGDVTISNLPALSSVTLGRGQGTIKISDNPQLTHISTTRLGYNFDDVDLSNNPSLKHVDLIQRSNYIKNIDITNSNAIETLRLKLSSAIPQLDVTPLTKLKELNIVGTSTSSYDLSRSSLLELIDINTSTINTITLPKTNTLTSVQVYGRLQRIDLDGITSLTNLKLPKSNLTQIDLSKQTQLSTLDLQGNAITSLDVSNNPELTSLNIGQNQITNLDLSANTALTFANASDNPLTSADLSQNTALTALHISNSGNANIDFSHLTELTSLSAASKNLSSFNGHNHTKLKWLDLSDNPITSIDLSAMPELSTLKLNKTQLSSLDVAGASNLYQLHASAGQLNSLTLPNEKSTLNDLRVSFNTLTDLPVAQYPNLRYLYVAGNQLANLDIGTLDRLAFLHLGDNAISDLDISNNSRLGCVSVYDNPLTQSTKDTLDQYASEFNGLRSITYTQATSEGQCGYDPYTPTP